MSSPTSDDTQLRLTELKTKLASQEENNRQMLTALNTILQLVAAMTANQNALPHTQPTTFTNPRKLNLKPSPPPNFDGDKQKEKDIVNACQAYFCIRLDQFPDKQTKIQWEMTYVNQGRAQKWVNRVYHWEATPANVGSPHFVNWDNFRSRFQTEFFPLYSDVVATKKLEGTTYFQGRQMVDDYLDNFRDLISESGYSDPKTIVVKFR